jgi:predicted nucleic acid-binding protein
MTFADIPGGAALFLDSNLFVYALVPDPQFGAVCTALLERIQRQELTGFTSAHVLAEVAHRLMTIEASGMFGYPYAGIAARLKRRPALVQQLTRFAGMAGEVARYGVQGLPVTGDLILAAAGVSQQTGLLTNDALVVAVMRHHNLDLLASHDADFDRVPGLTRYAPV